MRHRLDKSWLVAACAGAALCAAAGPAAAALLGPTPYLSSADSPFNGLGFSYFHLVDFEDGLNPTNANLTAGNGTVTSPSTATDSVDGDDGSIDGLGQGGHSWYPGASSTSFVFELTGLGALPTHVGIVWTDVAIRLDAAPFATGEVVFEAFDAAAGSLGTLTVTLGDGDFHGQTAEDRFFGAIFLDGISRIAISMPGTVDWEVDHLQFGAVAVPLPAAAWLLGPAVCGLVRLRHRRA